MNTNPNANPINTFSTSDVSTNDPFNDELDLMLLKIEVVRSDLGALNSFVVPCRQIVPEDNYLTDVDTTQSSIHVDCSQGQENVNKDKVGDDKLSSHNLPLSAGLEEADSTDINHDIHVNDSTELPISRLNNSDGSENEEIGVPHEFGDYGGYFANKKAKQQKADEDFVKWEKKRQGGVLPPQIFKGCSIHVNGHTKPSIDEIHRLVILRGGKFIAYLSSKGSVSHIVCDHLTPRKRNQFKNYNVVKAQWIADCVEKNELLDWTSYRLIKEIQFGQKRLSLEGSRSKNVEDRYLPEYQRQEIPAINTNEIIEEEIIEGDTRESDIFPLTHSQNLQDEEETHSQSAEIHISQINTDHNIKSGVTLDATHPDFLKHFFAFSRLHHLSKWKADLRAQFIKKILDVEKVSQPKDEIKKVILHVDFDCFFATASALNYPEVDIDKDPIAVSHGLRTSDVASCNYVARKHGVRNGMWMAQARKLCSNLIVLNYDFTLYEKSSKSFYDYFVNWNVFDSILPVLIDEVLIDASTFCNDQMLAIDLATKIRKDIFEITKCLVSVGMGPNVLLAKLATRQAKPNGQSYIDMNSPETISNVQMINLPGIGRKLVEKFCDDFGMKSPTVKDILPISLNRLQNSFGTKTGEKLFNYARGIDNTKIDMHEDAELYKRKTVSVDVNYGIRFKTMEQIDKFLMDLSKELYRRLLDLGVCGSSITLKLAKRAPNAPVDPPKYLGMGRCVFSTKTSKLGVPTNDWGVLGSELKAMYRIINIPIHELRGVAISMSSLENIDDVKKQRQMKLPYAHYLNLNQDQKQQLLKPIAYKPQPTTVPTEKINLQGIDWEVFENLPLSIKNEIEVEMKEQGLKISSSTKFLPTKKSPVKTNKLKMISSPSTDLASGPLAFNSIENDYLVNSFDSTVFDELPSSIQKEILKFVDDRKSNSTSPIKQKRRKIDEKWLVKQNQKNEVALFRNRHYSLPVFKKLLNGWIKSSLIQAGPHAEDVLTVVDYIEVLLQKNEYLRCLSIIKHLKTRVECEKSMFEVGKKKQFNIDELNLYNEAFQNWTQIVNTSMVFSVEKYCIQNDLEIDFSPYLLLD